MMKLEKLLIYLLISLDVTVLVYSDLNELEELWEEFKSNFNKTYNRGREKERKLNWERNMNKIQLHNQEAEKGLHNYTLKENQLMDLNTKRFLKESVGLVPSKHRKSDPDMVGGAKTDFGPVPDEFDWRTKGFDTPILNQKNCGSCYAFSITSIIEAQYFLKNGELKRFSQQQLVDCSVLTGNMGCSGGSFRNTLNYIDKVGLALHTTYPYVAKQGSCRYRIQQKEVSIKSWGILPANNELALASAVANIGPIAVSINASPQTFQLYYKGIYDDSSCPSDAVNHAMILVGYTKKAWILKNWWTSRWGDNGYMYLRRGVNRCGITNFAAYVKL